MHIPAHFRMPEREIVPFIREHNFGTLISSVDGLSATHLPFIVKEESPLKLQTHLAKANSMAGFPDGADVLITFLGEHCYVSSAWYERITAPTWNYRAVHCHGTVRLLDSDETLRHLEALVDHHEKPIGRKDFFKKIPTVDALLPYLKAYEITINRIEAACKLSQNHSENDIDRIVDELYDQQSPREKEVAGLMRAMRSNS